MKLNKVITSFITSLFLLLTLNSLVQSSFGTENLTEPDDTQQFNDTQQFDDTQQSAGNENTPFINNETVEEVAPVITRTDIQNVITENISDLVVNVPDFVSSSEIGEPVRVEDDPAAKQTMIDQIIENTFFISSNGLVNQTQDHKAVINADGVVGLTEFNSPQLQETYREILQTDQDWPFGRAQLLETGDYVAEIHLNTKSPDGTVKTITSTAVFDENNKLKFEPLMYFTPAEVFVGGSHHILEVKNALGWTVVRANITANVQSSDKCQITTPQERIAVPDFHTLPVWYVNVSVLSPIIKPSGQCETNPNLELQCAEAAANVAYSAFFPNWKVEGPNVAINKGDLPMATGGVRIYDDTCANGVKNIATTSGGSGVGGGGGIIESFKTFLDQLNPFKHLWFNFFEYF